VLIRRPRDDGTGPGRARKAAFFREVCSAMGWAASGPAIDIEAAQPTLNHTTAVVASISFSGYPSWRHQ
jgi:hypothetical protein